MPAARNVPLRKTTPKKLLVLSGPLPRSLKDGSMSALKLCNSTVPFVTLWSDEEEEHKKIRVKWNPNGLLEPEPDPRGVRWSQYGGSMSGDPLFAKVHPIRQKMCMEGPYCQVCGKTLIGSKIPWLLNGSTDPNLEALKNLPTILTTTPPICRECIPRARALCPHLRGRSATPHLLVKKWSIVGVHGDMYPTADPDHAQPGVTVRFDSGKSAGTLKFFLAKQLVVEIRHYRIVREA